PNVFRRVVQPPVANEEIESAARQVKRMHARDPARREGSGGDVGFPSPPGSFHGNTAARQAINGGEREVPGLAVVPAQTGENADIGPHLLFDAETCAVLDGPRTVYGSDIGSGSGLSGQAEGIGIIAGIGVIQISQQPNGAGTLPKRIAELAFE